LRAAARRRGRLSPHARPRCARQALSTHSPSQKSVAGDQEAPHLLPRGTLSLQHFWVFSGLQSSWPPQPKVPPKEDQGGDTHTLSQRADSSDPQHSGCKGSWSAHTGRAHLPPLSLGAAAAGSRAWRRAHTPHTVEQDSAGGTLSTKDGREQRRGQHAHVSSSSPSPGLASTWGLCCRSVRAALPPESLSPSSETSPRVEHTHVSAAPSSLGAFFPHKLSENFPII
jgi:hypothetical protein